MNWTERYQTNQDFMFWFLSEQEYIDAMFILIIMENYGIWLDANKFLTTV